MSVTVASVYVRFRFPTAVQLSETDTLSRALMAAAEGYAAGASVALQPEAVSVGNVPAMTGATVSTTCT